MFEKTSLSETSGKSRLSFRCGLGRISVYTAKRMWPDGLRIIFEWSQETFMTHLGVFRPVLGADHLWLDRSGQMLIPSLNGGHWGSTLRNEAMFVIYSLSTKAEKHQFHFPCMSFPSAALLCQDLSINRFFNMFMQFFNTTKETRQVITCMNVRIVFQRKTETLLLKMLSWNTGLSSVIWPLFLKYVQ